MEAYGLLITTIIIIVNKTNYIPTVVIVKRDGLRKWRTFKVSPQITLGFGAFRKRHNFI